MTDVLRIGISTCPNDTFAFHALLEGEVRLSGVELRFELGDVEELNRRWLAGEFDAAKLSFHAALNDAQAPWILSSGSALGSGVGPLVLAAPGADREVPRVLCPGRWTTATLLWELFHSREGEVEQCVFSDIMPRLERSEADLGVCIHEGRFTWREHGLVWVEDLGERWERETGALLPLGGIAARRALGRELALELGNAVGRSIDWARDHREAALTTMRRHAQELSDQVLWSHVELYVGEHTRRMGAEGLAALERLGEIARERGLAARESAPLDVLR